MFLDLIRNNGGFTLTKDLQAKQEGFACAISGHETVYNMDSVTELDIVRNPVSSIRAVNRTNGARYRSQGLYSRMMLSLSPSYSALGMTPKI